MVVWCDGRLVRDKISLICGVDFSYMVHYGGNELCGLMTVYRVNIVSIVI